MLSCSHELRLYRCWSDKAREIPSKRGNVMLLETCAREFAFGIERLFETALPIPGTGMAEIPVIGGRFHTWADHSHLLPSICRALVARERFAQDVPGWPVLPLHQDARAAME